MKSSKAIALTKFIVSVITQDAYFSDFLAWNLTVYKWAFWKHFSQFVACSEWAVLWYIIIDWHDLERHLFTGNTFLFYIMLRTQWLLQYKVNVYACFSRPVSVCGDKPKGSYEEAKRMSQQRFPLLKARAYWLRRCIGARTRGQGGMTVPLLSSHLRRGGGGGAKCAPYFYSVGRVPSLFQQKGCGHASFGR